MAEVGRQPREPRVKVDSLPIPTREPVHGERVPQVVRPRSDAADVWLETGHAEHPAERVARRFRRQESSIRREEEWIGAGGLGVGEHATRSEVLLKLPPQRPMKRYPPRAALEFLDEEQAATKVNARHAQPPGFADA